MVHPEECLILVIDDDLLLSHSIACYLKKHNFSVITTDNGAEALELMQEKKPTMAIVDIHIPLINGLDFLKKVRVTDQVTPIIVTTGDPNMDSVMEAIHNGAQDYIVKPFQMPTLISKINQTLETLHSHRNSHLLSELIAIHSVSNQLSGIQDHEMVLDIAFRSCMEAIKATHGYIMLANSEEDTLSLVRVSGEYHGSEISLVAVDDEWAAAKWVYKNNRAIVMYDGRSMPFQHLPFAQQVKGISIVAPLRVGEKVLGVVSMSLPQDNGNHGKIELSLIEILAAQIGTAINNAGLYKTLNQRISDLNFISNYAEQFVGMVEPEDVISSFIDTIRDYFDVDFIGALLIKKRFHPLLYWSRHLFSADLRGEIIEEAIDSFNTHSNTPISANRVKWSPLSNDVEESNLEGTFGYTKIIPLVWGEFRFGTFVLKWVDKTPKIEENIKLLRGIINQTRIALTNAKLFSDIKENYIRTIKALAIAVDAKDTYTHGHSENVMRYAEIIARHMGLSEDEVQVIKNGGLLHDIGKIGMPGYILNKPGPLTDDEFNGVMKTHPTLGANIIRDVPFLQELSPIILYHHENYDGTGYPLGLKGDEIPLGAQIVHIADAYEAMTSNRPYRKSLGAKEAIRRLKESSGAQFETSLVEIFIEAMVKQQEIHLSDIE